MSETKRRKTFFVQENMDILPEVGAERKHMLHRLPVFNSRVNIEDFSFKNRKYTKNVTHTLKHITISRT
jgi:hypothetical protein